MSKKISIGAALALALLMVAASIPLTMLYAKEQQNKIIANLPERIEKFQAMEEIREVVQNNYYAKTDEDKLTAAMVRGYINGLGHDLCRYMSAEEYQSYSQRILGQQPELGIELTHALNAESAESAGNPYGWIAIAYVKEGSPAAAAGLRKGDQILKAETVTDLIYDEKDLTMQNATTYMAKLTGLGAPEEEESNDPNAVESVTSVTITYQRDGEAKPPVSVMLGDSIFTTYSELMPAAVTEEDAEPAKTVGYIKIFQFYENTARQLDRTLRELSNNSASTYIIDLRGCSEGTIEYACKALDLLIGVQDEPMATINYTGSSARKAKTYPSDSYSLFPPSSGKGYTMAVLMDGLTAGPAELFAYNLAQCHPNSVVLIGTKTKGINTVQELFTLSQTGGAAMISVGTVTPISGDADWNKNGVEPTPQDAGRNLIYNEKNEASQLQGAIDALTLPVAVNNEQ